MTELGQHHQEAPWDLGGEASQERFEGVWDRKHSQSYLPPIAVLRLNIIRRVKHRTVFVTSTLLPYLTSQL